MEIHPEDYNRYEHDLDRQIEEVKNWIKYYYRNIENREQASIDVISHELDSKLERFFGLRQRKELVRTKREKNECIK